MADTKSLHLRVAPGDVHKVAILPSSHEWTDYLSCFLSDVAPVSSFREFKLVNGIWNGLPVTICSTGIGGQSTAIAVEELHRAGSEVFIRIGTAHPFDATLTGTVLLAQGASWTDGTVAHYLPSGYPAIADPSLLFALENAAFQSGVPYHIGTVFSPAVWHHPGESVGDLCVDLDTAAVFAVCAALRLRSASLLQLVGPEDSVDAPPAEEAVQVLGDVCKGGRDGRL
jgi:uridine phosphorylase